MEILSIHLLPAGFTLMLEQPYHLSQSWTRWLPHVWPQYEHENMLQYDAVRNHCIPSTRFWVEVSLLLPPWALEWVIDLWGPTSCHNPGVPSAPIWEVVQMKWETGLPFCLPLHLLPKMICSRKEIVAAARTTMCDYVTLAIYKLMKSICRESSLVQLFWISFKEIHTSTILTSLNFDYPPVNMKHLSQLNWYFLGW